MKDKVKLKHLNLFLTDKVNYSEVMKQVGEYKRSMFPNSPLSIYKFKKEFKKAYNLNLELSKIDPTSVEYQESWINFPKNVDFIPLIARLELETQLNRMDQGDLVENIASVIAIATYSSNSTQDYDSNSIGFKGFHHKILNSQYILMIGLFNRIKSDIITSNQSWSKKFSRVETSDPDFRIAGGDELGNFNVVRTIKNLCNDFNVDYKSAWQLPYSLTQTSSLESATISMIQDKMSKLKEKRMEAQRKAGK